ncbi:glycosyltransferase [Actinocorallia lasiicapitis]
MTIRLELPPELRTITDGVTVVMPAYNEEENVETTVRDFLDTLEAAGIEHRVVVVDDGSHDATGDVIDRLAVETGGRVVAVRQWPNQGYGAAVRAGIAAALDRTDLRWILLTDSDGQFKAAPLPEFLDVRRAERADAVIGYRRERADPLIRVINAKLWKTLCRVTLRTRTRDIDCAYKLIDRNLLDGVELNGEAAAISPELLSRISTGRTRIVEHPVEHHPRLHGSPTGASPKVILRSLLSLAGVYRDLVRDGHRWRRTRRLLSPKDRAATAVVLVATLLSGIAFAHYLRQGTILAYSDALSHLMISRRVLFSPTAGAAQLGGVWLPLPHLLTLPFVWMEDLYQSGTAGSLVSMASYVVTARYLYGIAKEMGGSKFAGVAAAAMFMANANVLYLQSTPMTETLLFACLAATVYHLQEWCRHGGYAQLALASLAMAAATLTRYEGWVLCLAVTAVVAYAALRKHRGYSPTESHVLFFGVVGYAGIFVWLGWNAVIFRDPLYWQSGEYAKPSLWVSAADKTIGDLQASVQTYLIAVRDEIGYVGIGLALAGLALYAWRNGFRVSRVAPYTLLVFLPFFVYALYSGQRPLHVEEIQGDSYNVRFGLIMVLAASVFAGYLATLLKAKAARAALAVAAAASVLFLPGTAALAEAVSFQKGGDNQRTEAASRWLRENYDGGLVLWENFGNEVAVFQSRVPTSDIVYEASYQVWEKSLADPLAHHIRWIYVRTKPGAQDTVCLSLCGGEKLRLDYDLVFSDPYQQIYREKDK